jgi:parvulin-like peptidyl-prolyl isomerase
MSRRFAFAALALVLGAAGDPPPSEIIAQRGDVRLTAADLRDMLNRSDPNVRARLEVDPAARAGFVRDRLLNEAMLAEARAKGWDQKPDIMQRANEARDAVILQSYAASLVPPNPAFPGDAEIAAAYEANKTRFMLPRQYHLAQIVVLVAPGASHDAEEEARRKAADLRAQAMKPKADFADLARKQSQDTASAERGGDQGWVREDELTPALKDAVVGLSENGITDLTRLPDGFHIVRLMGTKPAGPAAITDVKPQLVQALRQARAQQIVRAYIDDMLRKEPIQLNDRVDVEVAAIHLGRSSASGPV